MLKVLITQQKVVIDAPGGHDNWQLAASVNRNLCCFGYTLGASALARLAACAQDDIEEFNDELMAAIEDHTGADRFASVEPFYRNFPEEVMEKSEVELYLNAYLYYLLQYGFDAGELVRDAVTDPEKREHNPFSETFPREPKLLSLASAEDVAAEYAALVHGVGVSDSDLEAADAFAREHPEHRAVVFDTAAPFASHETKAKVAELFYGAYRESRDPRDLQPLFELLPTVNDILRFYAVLGGRRLGFTNIAWCANLAFVKIPPQDFFEDDDFLAEDDDFLAELVWLVDLLHGEYRPQPPTPRRKAHVARKAEHSCVNFPYALDRPAKHVIKALLKNARDLYTGVWAHEQIWQKIFTRYLDIKEDDGADLNAVKQNLYHKRRLDAEGREIVSPNACINRALAAYAAGEGTAALEAAATRYPGLFSRRFNEAFHAVLGADHLAEAQRVADVRVLADLFAQLDVTPATALTVKNLMSLEPRLEFKVASTKTGKLKVFPNAHFVPESEDEASRAFREGMLRIAFDGIDRAVARAADGRFRFGAVYVDPALDGFKIPQRNAREASRGSTLTRNSRIAGLEGRNLLIAGIWWKGDHADMDLSAVALGSQNGASAPLYWGKPRTSWGLHSGDYIAAPNGAEEIVVIDKARLRELGVEYVAFCVHGYSGTFDSAQECPKFVFSQREGSLDDENTLAKERDEEEPEVKRFFDGTAAAPAGYGRVLLNGEPLEVSTFDWCVDLVGAYRGATPIIYRVDADDFVWVDAHRRIDRGSACVVTGESLSANAALVLAAETSATPSMRQLVDAYINAGCGEYVDDPREADTVFLAKPAELDLKEGAVVHTALDLGYYSAHLVAAQPQDSSL